MGAPAWLDELALAPGPPWLSMGTHALGEATWLVADDDLERDLAHKAKRLTERHDDAFAALDTPEVAAASAEVLTLVEGATRAAADDALHPLDAAGRLVQEDLCILVLRDGAPHLDAASLCFPSYWRLADKLGRPLATVHEPVAHYVDELAARVDSFITRLRPDHPVWRRNWSIHDDPSYFLPGRTLGASAVAQRPPVPLTPMGPQVRGTSGRPPNPPAPNLLWLRSERQTLRRLSSADAVVFTIRTQQVPLAVLADRPDVARRMAAAIDAWSPEMRAYKGGDGALRATAWLAAC